MVDHSKWKSQEPWGDVPEDVRTYLREAAFITSPGPLDHFFPALSKIAIALVIILAVYSPAHGATNPMVAAPTGNSVRARQDGGSAQSTGSPGSVIVPAITTCAINNMPVAGSFCYPTLASCYAATGSAGLGNTCMVAPNQLDGSYLETLSADMVFDKNNAGFIFMGPATIDQGSFQLQVNDGVTGAFIVGQTPYGGPVGSSGGTRFVYTGAGTAWKFGDQAGTQSVEKTNIENVWLDISGAGASAIGFNGFALGKAYFNNFLIVGSTSPGNTQKDFVINDNAATFSGAILSSGLLVADGGIGIQLSDNTVESTFNETIVIGNSAAGSIGLDFEGGARSIVFQGGTISGSATAINFGGTSGSNSITIETDAATTDVAFGDACGRNDVIRMNSTGQPVPVISGGGILNLVRSPGGQVFYGGNLLDEEGPTAAFSGTGADQVIYSYVLKGGTLAPGRTLRVTFAWNKTQGANNTTYKLNFGGTPLFVSTFADGTATYYHYEFTISNNAGVSNAQHYSFWHTASEDTGIAVPYSGGTIAVDTTSDVLITFTADMPTADKVTGGEFLVELVQ